jgi:hypothetical protein
MATSPFARSKQAMPGTKGRIISTRKCDNGFFGNSAELERGLFRPPLSIGNTGRGTFGHIPASLPHQPLPFPADMQHGQITGAERRPFERKAAVFVLCEPFGLHG